VRVGMRRLAGGAGSVRPVTVKGCARRLSRLSNTSRLTGSQHVPGPQPRPRSSGRPHGTILRVAGGGPQGVWRRRAAQVPGSKYLITGPAPSQLTAGQPSLVGSARRFLAPRWAGTSRWTRCSRSLAHHGGSGARCCHVKEKGGERRKGEGEKGEKDKGERMGRWVG